SRRRLRDEGVRPIRVDGDDNRDDEPFVLRRLRVEVLAEVHDVDALRAERGADGRRRRRLAGGDLQLNDCLNFLCHGRWPTFLTLRRGPTPAACRPSASLRTTLSLSKGRAPLTLGAMLAATIRSV